MKARGATRRIAEILVVAVIFPAAALGQATVTGRAVNKTRNVSAAGDEAILLRFSPKMQEEARVKTDAHGAFSFVEPPGANYLVRVVHDGVNYDHPAVIGQMLEIPVYDAVTAHRVRGISGNIEILQARAHGKSLHVSDMYEVSNRSMPPVTQAGLRTFDVYVPQNAKIDLILAAGPSKIPTVVTAKAVPGQTGHYFVSFPLQPGATKFAFNYDVPYSGTAIFRTRRAVSVQQFAVMIPASMNFSSASRKFSPLPVGGAKYQVEAANVVAAGAGPTFELSGYGALPDESKGASAAASSPTLVGPPPGSTAAASEGDSASRISQMFHAGVPEGLWMAILLGVLVTVAACGFLFWRARSHGRERLGANGGACPNPCAFPLADALRREQDRLENDRQRGLVSDEEYNSTRQALEIAAAHALRPHD